MIETENAELKSVKLFNNYTAADARFELCILESGGTICEFETEELKEEIPGIIRMAGDDVYAVQLIKIEAP